MVHEPGVRQEFAQPIGGMQAEALQNRIRPMRSFLYRCRRRLDVRGFDAKSEVYREIDKGYGAMHSLHVTLIYEACGRGVGKASQDRSGLTLPKRREVHRLRVRRAFNAQNGISTSGGCGPGSDSSCRLGYSSRASPGGGGGRSAGLTWRKSQRNSALHSDSLRRDFCNWA